MKKLAYVMACVCFIFFGRLACAAEASLQEVYQAASGGHVDKAQKMMSEVLHNHPNSAKAHYVEAELLFKQGKTAQAAGELSTAEKLSPGLSFASAQSVNSLKTAINHGVGVTVSPRVDQATLGDTLIGQRRVQIPWGIVIVSVGAVLLIIVVTRAMSQRNALNIPRYGNANAGMPMNASMGAPVQGYPNPQSYTAAQGGLGSQMLGGLATGAAVGAGMVAGEALMHRLMDGGRLPESAAHMPDVDPTYRVEPSGADSYDMGGDDFGIAGDTSWDDSSSASNDWDV